MHRSGKKMKSLKQILRPVSPLSRSMFRSAFTSATLSEFFVILSYTIDSLIVCNFMGADEIAAVGVAYPVFYLSSIPAACIAAGLRAVCSREMGRGRIREVNERISETLLLITLYMIGFTALYIFAVPFLATAFGASGSAAHLHPLTCEYLYGLAPEAAPYVLMSVLTPVILLDNGNRLVTVSSIAQGVTDVVIDLLAVHFHWGLFGIGMASSVSVVVSLLILLLHFVRKKGIFRLQRTAIQFKRIGEIIKIGLPNVVHSAAGMARSILMNNLVVGIAGSIGMTVLSIQGTIVDFVSVASYGVAGTVGILSGLAYGEKNGEDLEQIKVLSHRYIGVFCALIIPLLILFRSQIAGFFLPAGGEDWELLRFAILCISAGLIPDALIRSRISYLQVIEKGKSAELLESAANFTILLAFVLLLSHFFGIRGIYAAFPAASVAVLFLILWVYRNKLKKIRLAPQDLMSLDRSFYPEAEDFIEQSVSTKEECVACSEKVHAFCKNHQCDPKTANSLSLCTEEILTNILDHGVRKKYQQPMAGVRLAILDGKLFLRIRDNGNAFNMSELAKMLDEETTPGQYPGLRMICAASDDISYYRIYGMNNTILQV